MQSIKEKTADELFEEIGYKKTKDNEDYCTYEFLHNGTKTFEINFFKRYNDIGVNATAGIYGTVDLDELKAINKKCKELGWI